MSVHRYFIVAVGLIILIDIVAFGDGNQVTAQVAQPAKYHRDHKLADLTSSPGETQKARKAKTSRQQDKGQDKSQVGRSAPPSPAMAPESGAVSRPDLPASDLQDSVCLMIEAAGRAHDLPPEFFVRVIWQESRFRPDTVGPRRRNGESAQGIAQFMPSTAAERGLLDPFDPVQALPKAAQFLRELKDQFGNLGLAAAAYNAGPARVRAWLAGARNLSVETRNYVVAVTGVPAEDA
jgi:soluble lytic murein transglycosylase-like protein